VFLPVIKELTVDIDVSLAKEGEYGIEIDPLFDRGG
jgi:hypothetical protein